MSEITDSDIRLLAHELRDEVKAGNKRKAHPRAAEANVEEAYRLQRAYQEILESEGAGEIYGYKIALTSDAMQNMVGIDHPLAGTLYRNSIFHGNTKVNLNEFRRLGVEFEIAVKLSSDLVNIGRPHNIETVSASVASVAPAFELVDDRDADYDALEACGLIAENCWNAGVVIGEYRDDFDVSKLPGLETRLNVNGADEDLAHVGDVMGHPFAVVAWMADLLISQGGQLDAGMTVMTGSSMKTRFPDAGTQFRFAVEGLGSVELETV